MLAPQIGQDPLSLVTQQFTIERSMAKSETVQGSWNDEEMGMQRKLPPVATMTAICTFPIPAPTPMVAQTLPVKKRGLGSAAGSEFSRVLVVLGKAECDLVGAAEPPGVRRRCAGPPGECGVHG